MGVHARSIDLPWTHAETNEHSQPRGRRWLTQTPTGSPLLSERHDVHPGPRLVQINKGCCSTSS